MRGAATRVAAAIAIISGIAGLRAAEGQVRAPQDCAAMERAEQLNCLDEAPRTVATADQAASRGDNWTISQTTSPVDYSPVASATTSSHDASESALKLSIRCRGGRTELVVAGPGILGRGNDYSIAYRVNDGPQVRIAAAPPASGAGVAFGGDVIGLLQSLPDAGSFSVHLTPRTGVVLDGMFSLGGWEAVRAKLTVACKWSHPAAKPNSDGPR